MVVQLLEKQKDWVIGHKIVDVLVSKNEIRINMDDGKSILIGLEKSVGMVPNTGTRHSIYFEVELSHQVAIPSKE